MAYTRHMAKRGVSPLRGKENLKSKRRKLTFKPVSTKSTDNKKHVTGTANELSRPSRRERKRDALMQRNVDIATKSIAVFDVKEAQAPSQGVDELAHPEPQQSLSPESLENDLHQIAPQPSIEFAYTSPTSELTTDSQQQKSSEHISAKFESPPSPVSLPDSPQSPQSSPLPPFTPRDKRSLEEMLSNIREECTLLRREVCQHRDIEILLREEGIQLRAEISSMRELVAETQYSSALSRNLIRDWQIVEDTVRLACSQGLSFKEKVRTDIFEDVLLQPAAHTREYFTTTQPQTLNEAREQLQHVRDENLVLNEYKTVLKHFLVEKADENLDNLKSYNEALALMQTELDAGDEEANTRDQELRALKHENAGLKQLLSLEGGKPCTD